MSLFFVNILALLGSGQGVFVAFLLGMRPVPNKTAARHLIALVLMISFLLLAKYSYRSNWFAAYAGFILVPDVILFITGPCIYFTTRYLMRMVPLRPRQFFLHTGPALLYLLIVCPILGLILSGKTNWLSVSQIQLSFYIIEGSGIGSLLFYLSKSFQLVKQEIALKKNPLIAPVAASFLPLFLRFGLVLAACWSISFTFRLLTPDQSYLAYQIFWLLLAAYVYWLAFMALLKIAIFDLPTAPKKATASDEQQIQRIQTFLQKSKIHQEPGLKLEQLATELQLSRHELSRLLNLGFGQSFFDLINELRIRDFILLHRSDQKSSILQTAYSVGFNSKSAFNRAFRKHTGSSPTVYLKKRESKLVEKT